MPVSLIPVPEWISDAGLDLCRAWMAEGPGIVWVHTVAFAIELARRTGAAYHRAQGRDAAGTFIEDAPGEVVIASIATCREGCNLQGRWNRNLVAEPPATADAWEQLIGRTHREGQAADEVSVDVVDVGRALEAAMEQARYVESVTGHRGKLLLADVEGES